MVLNMAKNLGVNLQALCLLLVRLQLGTLFVKAGWGKLNSIDRTVGFFSSINIPAPQVMAPFVGLVEFLGGLLLLAGLLSRLSSAVLMVVMIVAILAAHMSELTGFYEVMTHKNLFYFSSLMVILCFGAGKASVDSVVLGEKA